MRPRARRSRPGARPPEILWDRWGVPHLCAGTPEDLFFACGWAQMVSHRSVLLREYGKARGRAAEYWGAAWLESDRWVRLMGVPDRARRWRARQSKAFGRCLDAFAAGINAQARSAPGQIPPELAVVLPVDATDVLAHVHAVIHFSFLVDAGLLATAASALAPDPGRRARPLARPRAGASTDPSVVGSNAWTIAPARSGGGTLLLGNPHLYWRGAHLFFEAHWRCGPLDFYGATLIGFPVPTLGFSRFLAWTHTMNRTGGVDLYRLTLDRGGYRYDGSVRRFDARDETLHVRGPRGGLRAVRFRVRRSVHGPVIATRGRRAIAARVAGLDTSGICEQWWRMAGATDLAGFESALRRLDIPIFNVLYADRAGHVMHLFGGRVPARPPVLRDRAGVVPGTSSATLWTRTYSYEELPRAVDPASGWLQNANEAPWTDTLPPVLGRESFADDFPAGPPTPRAQRTMHVLRGRRRLGLADVLRLKCSTRSDLADRLVPDLVRLARASPSATLRRAAGVLERWDRCTRATSRGAVLFVSFIEEALRLGRGIPFREPWDPGAPLATPHGLRRDARLLGALRRAAERTQARYGALDRSWGAIYRLRVGALDLPAAGGPGGLGILRVLEFEPAADGCQRACAGDSFMFAVEYAAGRVGARVLLTYGNASEPESPHRTDQLGLFAAGRWRTPLLTRRRILAELERRERLCPFTPTTAVPRARAHT